MRGNSFGTGFMYVLLVFLTVGLALMIYFNYQANTEQMAEIEAEEIAAATTPTPEPTATPEPTPTPNRITENVTLAFAGDLVGQPGLATDAETTDGDDVSYDFFEELEGVVSSLTGADLSACTLVGTISETGPYEEGYRLPASMATALAGAGFQVVNAATDHILDQDINGLTETVDIMKNEGLVVAGAYENEASHGAFVANVHGIDVAILSYTYGTGGVSVVDAPWCLDIYTSDYMTDQETVDYDRIDGDIAAVKEAGADIVVCFLYWWDNTQYYPQPRQNQTDLADHLFESGVDVIVGAGVKTPQPIDVRVVERADGTKANCVALYSLSNLMSCFNDRYTNLSATAKIVISRDTNTDETWVSGVSYDPLFMLDTDDYDDYNEPGYKYRLLDAYDAIESYEEGERTISEKTYDAIVDGVKDLQDIFGADYDAANGGVMLEYPY